MVKRRAIGRNVLRRLVHDRVEDRLAAAKRHPTFSRHPEAGRNGRPTAIEVDALFDGGAYATPSALVLSRGMIHAHGPDRCDHLVVRGRAVMAHTPSNGVFRGWVAPQTQFAAEVHMDRIADQLGIDLVRLREVKLLRPADTTLRGQWTAVAVCHSRRSTPGIAGR